MRARGIPVIDATCPHVAHIHQLVRQYSEHGDAVVIVGGRITRRWSASRAGRAEGFSFCPTRRPPNRRSCRKKRWLSRRRQSGGIVLTRFCRCSGGACPDLTERITICAATSQRQQEAEKLSGEADVMVVVGGRNSSNTQKLLETCRLRCKRSVLVETPEDVPPDLAEADDRVALTAGRPPRSGCSNRCARASRKTRKQDKVTQKTNPCFRWSPPP